MNRVAVIFFTGCILCFSASVARTSCPVSGYVYCDVNQNRIIDEGDEPLGGVSILLDGVLWAMTDENGYYYILEHAVCNSILSLDKSTISGDVIFIEPGSNGVNYYWGLEQDWLIDSETCHPTE